VSQLLREVRDGRDLVRELQRDDVGHRVEPVWAGFEPLVDLRGPGGAADVERVLADPRRHETARVVAGHVVVGRELEAAGPGAAAGDDLGLERLLEPLDRLAAVRSGHGEIEPVGMPDERRLADPADDERIWTHRPRLVRRGRTRLDAKG